MTRGTSSAPRCRLGIALDKRSGRDAARNDLERNHVASPHDHLVVVVVFAAVEIVGRQAAKIEQTEDSRGRLRGKPALAGNLVAPSAVARGDVVHLRDDELVRLPGILVKNLRLSARDLDAFIHDRRTSI